MFVRRRCKIWTYSPNEHRCFLQILLLWALLIVGVYLNQLHYKAVFPSNIMDSSDLLFNKYQDAQSFCTDAFDIVQQVCASSNNLPEAGEEYDFYQSFTEVADVLASFRNRLLISVNKLLKNYTSSPPLGSMEENADEHIETLIEANDELLERISNGIDEAGGVRKHSTTVVKTKTSTWRSPAVRYSAGVGMISKSNDLSRTDQPYQSILKPQLYFSDPVDNTDAPFIPKLNFKPNSIKPLPFKLTCNRRRLTSDLLCHQPEILDHPYLCEIESCNSDESLLVIRDPQSPADWNECPFTLVNSKKQLCEMVESLKLCKDIAIDLEHHSLRSYMGFTCLIQISTRAADFIVDAFSLREHLHLLNEITTNSSILKVFHGADNDIVWLQKDFGVYVVNMFDTHQAARILGFPYLSLSYLLKRYCDVDTAKRYQRADWRVRPLPSELVDYARTDTHYLLYIYDLLRNELVEKGTTTNNLLHTVYDRSKCICLKKYEKPMFQDTDFLKLVKNSCRVFNSRQLHALKLLYAWRDRVAREEDESVDYVLPNHMLMKIAEYLPKEKQGIFGCCNPIPVHVKQNLVEIHQYVISAREVELKKQEEDFANEDEYFEPPPFDPESVLNCVHDHIHSSDNVTKEFEGIDTY
ncbi:hypothetical protein GJ496_007695 [Pomphorhynchus laevis]|nr:hypothetical protein GJ496_007695 [Pomphorhynchus laevis]